MYKTGGGIDGIVQVGRAVTYQTVDHTTSVWISGVSSAGKVGHASDELLVVNHELRSRRTSLHKFNALLSIRSVRQSVHQSVSQLVTQSVVIHLSVGLAEKRTDRLTHGQTAKQPNRQKYSQTYRQKERQNRQTHKVRQTNFGKAITAPVPPYLN